MTLSSHTGLVEALCGEEKIFVFHKTEIDPYPGSAYLTRNRVHGTDDDLSETLRPE